MNPSPLSQIKREDILRLLEVSRIINSTLKLDEVLERVMDLANKIVNSEASSLLLIDKEAGRLFFKTATGEKAEEIKKFTLKLGQGIAGWVAKKGEHLLVPDVTREPRFNKEIAQAIGFPARSILCVPLMLQGSPAGAIEVINKAGGCAFNEEDLSLLEWLSNQAMMAIENAWLHGKLNEENRSLKQTLSNRYTIVGSGVRMNELMKVVEKVAQSNSTLLLRGESGTGKELIANRIHALSRRAAEPFVCITCSILTETLLESELFGYEKGAFTGADKRRIGRFELADKGTIFLDEVGAISLNIQLKLLRVLQEKEFERVGGNETLKTDVRIIAATNENLERAIKEGRFREDLYYRLKVIEIEIPPLREHKEDIPELLEYFLGLYSRQMGRRAKRISMEALDILTHYDWPGNVRELKNTAERAIVLGAEEVLLPEHLPAELRVRPQIARGSSFSLEEAEKAHIKGILETSGGNRSKAARLLGISRNRLSRKIERYGLSRMV